MKKIEEAHEELVTDQMWQTVCEELEAKGFLKKVPCCTCGGGWKFTEVGLTQSEEKMAKIGLKKLHDQHVHEVATELSIMAGEQESTVLDID